MAAKAEQGNALTRLLANRWEQVSRKIERLAEILPEDGIEKAPVNGIRTYSAVLRQTAFWNQYVADCLNGKTTDDTSNELTPRAIPFESECLSGAATKFGGRRRRTTGSKDISGPKDHRTHCYIP